MPTSRAAARGDRVPRAPGAALALALALAALTSMRAAHAEGTPEERALAASLFEEAKAAMAGERWAEACPKLEESQRLDPGGGTLLNLAVCHDRLGRTASAWAEYREALAIARREGRASRVALATARLDALAPQVPHLRVQVPAELAARRDAHVLLDGRVELRPAAWGTLVPIDPGPHELRVTADGVRAWARAFEVSAGGEVELSVPPLVPEPEPSLAQAPPQPSSPGPPTPDTRASTTPADPDPASTTWIGAFARLDVDARLRGAGAALGMLAAPTPWLELGAGARLGPTFGAEVSAACAWPRGSLRPGVALVVPAYAADGVRAGLGVRVGVRWLATPRVAVGVGFEVARFPSPPADVEPWLLAPSIGALGWL